MKKDTLLIELGTEELPPKALLTLRDAFKHFILEGLTLRGVPMGQVKAFAAPRRLALSIQEVGEQPSQTVIRRGPSLKAAFDAQGQPTKAALGFAASLNVPMDALEQEVTDKGTWLIYHQKVAAQPISAILENILQDALAKLPIPKRMRWSDLPYEFVRPVQWLVAMLGSTVIPIQIMGHTASNKTYGHRFMHPASLTLKHADDYEKVLKTGTVCANFEERREMIKQQTLALAKSLHAEPCWSDALVDEVTGLVEWPTAMMASFEERFLAVPPEVLISAMQDHQRYFPLKTSPGLLPSFVFISNMNPEDPQEIIHGNARVIRARLEDAAFFYENDKKTPLKDRISSLDTLTFERRLGSVGQKVKRIAILASALAENLALNMQNIHDAAMLCKADLGTGMVGEFPELQGTMGRYYASNDGISAEVCLSLQEHYLPRFATDSLPTSPLGLVLSLADRLDTLVGFFGHNEIPSGTKDPYGLRRAALAVLRLCIETPLQVDLSWALSQAQNGYDNLPNKDAAAHVLSFCLARLDAYYSDKGISSNITAAAIASGSTRLSDLALRTHALASFQALPEAISLASANKRVANLLKKSPPHTSLNPALFEHPDEKSLAKELLSIQSKVATFVATAHYHEALTLVATLKANVDTFFENVMIMVDDQGIAQNRLALLAELQTVMMSVGDISLLIPNQET